MFHGCFFNVCFFVFGGTKAPPYIGQSPNLIRWLFLIIFLEVRGKIFASSLTFSFGAKSPAPTVLFRARRSGRQQLTLSCGSFRLKISNQKRQKCQALCRSCFEFIFLENNSQFDVLVLGDVGMYCSCF